MATAPIHLSQCCTLDARTVALAGWLHKVNASVSSSLEIGGCQDNRRGLYVRHGHELATGTVLATLPLALVVTRERAVHDPYLTAVNADQLGATNSMALFLVGQLKNESSFWQPWVASLPRKLATTLSWDAAQLAELQASDLISHSATRASAVSRHFEYVRREYVPDLESSEWTWALSTVWSRSHTVDLGGGAQGALLPLIDLFNADVRTPNVRGTTLESDRLVLRAAQLIGSNEEARVPYGSHRPLPNAQLLMEYGFCVQGNPNDDVALPLALPQHVASDASRINALRTAGLLHAVPRLSASAAPLLPPEVYAFARIATVQPAAAAAGELEAAISDMNGFLGRARECVACIDWILGTLLARVSEYETTLAEDEELLRAASGEPGDGALAGRSFTDSKICAILVRSSEKRILHGHADALRAALDVIKGEMRKTSGAGADTNCPASGSAGDE